MAYRHSPIAAYSGDDLESRSGDDRPESVELGDKPIYLLEHLATFTVTKESGILYPADGMRKLLQLEKTTGIWSQKMQLCLDRNWVLIVDYETGNVIEKFPASSIQEPTAFTSNDPMEMYNNILVFIVGTGAPHSRSEMHIFQCQSISAVHLVEDLKQLRDGKLINHRESQFEPRRPLPMAGGNRPNRAEYTRDRDRERERDYHNNHNDTDSELGGINDETSSTSSEKYERDVTVLNHCFDDIEKFIARLQHAAAASRELERRRKNRKSKKKDPGEGLLTLRTRPPHEKEFVDIFAKFKLSFNLLAKLKAHIHDPNAPELVHFLFTPLALIVDASHDSCYDPNLPARVVKPLLTREAINLLVNCVTSKETELWRSLGDAWTVPRDQWKDGMVGAYHPVFFDGWSPEYPVIDELEPPSTPNSNKKRFGGLPPHAAQDYGGPDDFEYQGNNGHRAATNSPGLRDFSNRSEISVDSIERNGGGIGGGGGAGGPMNGSSRYHEAANAAAAAAAIASANAVHNTPDSWMDDLQAKGAKVVQVTYPRTANNDKELTVVRGEYLEILDDTRKWWKARNSRGQVAHVPHTIVSVVSYENGDSFYGSKKPENLQDRYQSSSNNDPSGDWARNKHIVNNNNQNLNRMSGGGTVPGPFDYGLHKANTNGSSDAKVNVVASSSLKGAPAPPPPPMPLTIPTTPLAKKSFDSRSVSVNSSRTEPQTPLTTPVTDDMQRELREVLTLFKEKKRNIEFTKTPEVYIQQSSTPNEVQNWLKQKGFSEHAQKRLIGVGGNELFGLNKNTIEDYCGVEEARRLISQLNVQRNISGYKTTRSSELLSILAKVRQKSEPREDESFEHAEQNGDDHQNGFQNGGIGTESET